MIQSIDAYLVGLEFNQEELEAISHRGYLYGAIFFASLLLLFALGLLTIDFVT